MSHKQVLRDKCMNPVMCSFEWNVSTWVIASKNGTDHCWLVLSCSAPCCVCMQAPTPQGPEVSLVLTVQGLWLTCMDPAAKIQLWATTSVLLALSLALGSAPASQWVLRFRPFVLSDGTLSLLCVRKAPQRKCTKSLIWEFCKTKSKQINYHTLSPPATSKLYNHVSKRAGLLANNLYSILTVNGINTT